MGRCGERARDDGYDEIAVGPPVAVEALAPVGVADPERPPPRGVHPGKQIDLDGAGVEAQAFAQRLQRALLRAPHHGRQAVPLLDRGARDQAPLGRGEEVLDERVVVRLDLLQVAAHRNRRVGQGGDRPPVAGPCR